MLLGNGFNNSLGIGTSYSEIFDRMKREYPEYKKVERFMQKNSNDIEILIDYLKSKVEEADDQFLKRYIERKVKSDFMDAVNDIVQENLKNVYNESNESIHLLFKEFTNYFTLNFDPVLYLLLMKFKKSSDSDAMAMKNTLPFVEKDLDATQNRIYSKIKEARTNGKFEITIDNRTKERTLKKSTKSAFVRIVKEYFKDEEKWRAKDIERACEKLLNEESKKVELEVNDGFFKDEFVDNYTQNLYFLHGAFHITELGKKITKITQQQNEAFREKLEKAINDEGKGIVCVLTGNSEEKKDTINDNAYLRKCFDELSKLSGSLVVFGSSLADNDLHIFEQIVRSQISNIYISSREESSAKDFNKAKKIFGNSKKIVLFDYTTVNYSDET